MKTPLMDTPLIETDLALMLDICESIGIDTTKYNELISEMYWDGFFSREIKEQIEIIEDKEKYSHLRSI